MKNVIAVIILMTLISFSLKAQQANAELLKEPATWQFERFALPPQFAPNFPYKGVEELRFSPGMFNKDSSDYFSYAFVAQLDNTPSVSQLEIKNYLLTYFKGLCSSTAKQRNLSLDTSQINVLIEKQNNTSANTSIYNAVLNIFGVFADGAAVTLNMEIKVLNDVKAQKTYLVVIASPNKKTDEIWQELYKIQNNFSIPVQS